MWTQTFNIIKVTEDRKKKQQDQLIIEKESDIIINNQFHFKILHTPQHEKELALGYALSNKLIKHKNSEVKYDQENNKLFITGDISQPDADKISRDYKSIDRHLVFELSAYLQEKAYLYKKTAITESAALAIDNKIIAHAEDISIENALYKTIGIAVTEHKNDFENYSLLLSAKIDSRLMALLLKLNIPVIISRTAATKQAVDLAKANNINLIGFARGRRFNHYN